jgi:hypothetical protein
MIRSKLVEQVLLITSENSQPREEEPESSLLTGQAQLPQKTPQLDRSNISMQGQDW